MTATARRGHGEGSVYRDAANGTWVGAISLGWRPDGSRIRRKVTGRTKTEVRYKLKKLQAEAPRELRHTFVSVMSESGVAVEEIAHLAGHASSRTTETIYRHELRPVITTGADVMDRIFISTTT
jgi:integrase